MIRKLLIYFKSGGLLEVLTYIKTYIKKKFFYKSITVFLYYRIQEQPEIKVKRGNLRFIKINNLKELGNNKLERLRTVDYHQWLNSGSNVIVGIYRGSPVSYTWTHFNKYDIRGTGCIDLGDNKCWIGPTFVHKKYRGKGINKAQIQYQLTILPTDITYALTSTNIDNIPSLKSFERLGFVKGAILTQKIGLFAKRKSEIEFKNEGKDIYLIE